MSEVKEKKKFNKLTIAVIVLAVALVAAIGGIVGVYAATQQNVSTNFSVGYSIGDNVAVAIGACYVPSDGSGTPTWFTPSTPLTKQENNLYTINANEVNDTPYLEGDHFTYSGIGYDEVRFYFENISDQVIRVAYTLSLYGTTNSGVTITSVNGIRISTAKDINMTYIECGGVVSNTLEASSYENDTMSLQYYTINPGEIYCITFAMKPLDVNKSANFIAESSTTFWISRA